MVYPGYTHNEILKMPCVTFYAMLNYAGVKEYQKARTFRDAIKKERDILKPTRKKMQ